MTFDFIPNRQSLMMVAFFSALTLLGGCETTPVTGGTYPAVTAEQLVKTKFSHRTGQKKFDFDWVFDAETFSIDGVTIPPDLLEAMLGPGAKPQKITGTWEIRDNNIHFFVETGDASGSVRECSLPIFYTGVIRIQTPYAQYVF